MAKPIALIYIPETFSDANDRNWIYDLMRGLNGDTESKYKYEEKWQDYLWFVFYKEGITEPELQVFHEKDWTDIQQQELKELVLNSIPKNK